MVFRAIRGHACAQKANARMEVNACRRRAAANRPLEHVNLSTAGHPAEMLSARTQPACASQTRAPTMASATTSAPRTPKALALRLDAQSGATPPALTIIAACAARTNARAVEGVAQISCPNFQ